MWPASFRNNPMKVEKISKTNEIKDHRHTWVRQPNGNQVCKSCGKVSVYENTFDAMFAKYVGESKWLSNVVH